MKIGIMGIGLMGEAFARRFMAEGHNIGLYNRSPEKLHGLIEQGALAHDSSAALLEQTDIIILMASDAAAIFNLVSNQACQEHLAGKTIVQMATISPQQSRDIADFVQSYGADYLEAPVLGSIPEALDGSLIIMAGGEAAVFDKARPVLQVLGSAPKLIGEVGAGAALKLAMNQLIAALTAGFSLSLGFALKNHVDVDTFMDTVRSSALYAKTYDKKLGKYLERSFAGANFSTKHLLKDVRLFIEDAQQAGMDTSAIEGIERVVSQAMAADLADLDYSSIYQIINPPTDA
ncbi:MAG: NAD(P)-dependent oxidoreductase [Gammaproteobacteria bacterium]|nr:NAD(P)-dependent oxidoreductase [Gammaproteobacteria bacterium]